MNDERTFSIDELAELTGTSRRTIRFYVQSNVLDRPEGVARGAYYTRRHLQRVLDIMAWQAEGLTIEGIRQRISAADASPPPRPRSPIEVWTRITLMDGVELNINAEVAGLSPETSRGLADGIREMLKTLTEGKKE